MLSADDITELRKMFDEGFIFDTAINELDLVEQDEIDAMSFWNRWMREDNS